MKNFCERRICFWKMPANENAGHGIFSQIAKKDAEQIKKLKKEIPTEFQSLILDEKSFGKKTVNYSYKKYLKKVGGLFGNEKIGKGFKADFQKVLGEKSALKNNPENQKLLLQNLAFIDPSFSVGLVDNFAKDKIDFPELIFRAQVLQKLEIAKKSLSGKFSNIFSGRAEKEMKNIVRLEDKISLGIDLENVEIETFIEANENGDFNLKYFGDAETMPVLNYLNLVLRDPAAVLRLKIGAQNSPEIPVENQRVLDFL